MNTSVLQKIAREMLAFRDLILFEADEEPMSVVRAAIASNPKLVYYLRSYKVRGSGRRYEISPQYENKETKPGDLVVASSHSECLHYMCQGVGNYKKKLAIVAKSGFNIKEVVNEFNVKHASFYSNLTWITYSEANCLGDFRIFEFEFDYRIGNVKLNMMELEVDAEVERLSKLLFTSDMPIEAKIYLAHNYLTSTVLYRKNHNNSLNSSYTQSAYGALIKKECVCQGYAEAFKRIMDYNGIECEVICGQVIGSSVYHAWNIVSLGRAGDYYHIDVTWDAADGKPNYTYFCKHDSFFDGKRTWNRDLYPVCKGRYAVLSVARKYVYINKSRLLEKGIDLKVLDY